MTHGEKWFQRKQAIDLKTDVEGCGSPSNNLPPKMARDEAAKYYNTKFFKYWHKKMQTKYSIEKLQYLMFGSGERKLLLEELTCTN